MLPSQALCSRATCQTQDSWTNTKKHVWLYHSRAEEKQNEWMWSEHLTEISCQWISYYFLLPFLTWLIVWHVFKMVNRLHLDTCTDVVTLLKVLLPSVTESWHTAAFACGSDLTLPQLKASHDLKSKQACLFCVGGPQILPMAGTF